MVHKKRLDFLNLYELRFYNSEDSVPKYCKTFKICICIVIVMERIRTVYLVCSPA